MLRRSILRRTQLRILFLATNLPVPPNNGQAIRSLSILQALASAGHQITFVSFAPQGRAENCDPLNRYCHEIALVTGAVHNLFRRTNYAGRISSLLKSRAYSVERFRSQDMSGQINIVLSNDAFDLILADGIYALVNLFETDVPIALNCHNIEHLIFERYVQTEENQLKRWYALTEARWVRNYERRAVQRASLAMVCSERDRHLLQQLRSDLPVCVVPNCIDTDLYDNDGLDKDLTDAPTLLFQASLDWYPNRDAVQFFVESVFPLILKEVPGARFVVAGRNPPKDFMEKFKALHNVEFTGTVADMRPYLSSATLVVVPLRVGSGTRIKIVEACAAGKATVSTTLGAEGLDVSNGEEIMLADEPKDFAASVVNLLRNPVRRHAIAQAGHAKIVERYSLPALRRSIDEV